MATEVINLNSAAAFADHLKQAYSADLNRLEGITAWLGQNAPGSGLHASFAAAQGRTADIADKAAELSAHFAGQLAVRDAVEAAGGNALDKDALTPGT